MVETKNKRVNNERVPVSMMQQFLCFHCGVEFSVSLDYQKHFVIQHQVPALCYQINESEKKYEKELAKQMKQDPVIDNDITSLREANRRREAERLEEERKERKRANDRKRRAAKREEENRKYTPVAECSTSSYVAPIPPPRPPPAAFESSKLEVIDQNPETNCPFCDKTSLVTPLAAIEHAIAEHDGTMPLMYVRLFDAQGELVHDKKSRVGGDCNPCKVLLRTPTEYYLHLLQKHRAAIIEMIHATRPTAERYQIDVLLRVGNFESTIEFTGIIRKSLFRT